MATIDNMLAAESLSESEVIATIKLEPFEVAMIGYATKKRVSLVSSIVDKIWTITLNGFNTTRFNLEKIGQEVEIEKSVGKATIKEKRVVTLDNFLEVVKEMIDIINFKPKRKPSKLKIKHIDCKPLKLGEMSRLCEKKFKHLPYIGMWDTGHQGVQIGAKVLQYDVIKGESVAILQEGYFVNGVFCGQDFTVACGTADYYLEYVGG